jgi:putative ABC transport system permease protein
MLRSFFIVSLRNLFVKNRLFTAINMLGLAVGIACFILVALFVREEYNFDRYHKNAERIYRIVVDFTSEGNVMHWARSSAPIGHYLTGAYPEFEQVVRIRKNPGTDLLSHDENNFYEERIFFADSALFKVFDFKLVLGNPSAALRDKNSIIITEKLAKKFFGKHDVIGYSLRLNNQVDLKITGLLEEVPRQSHFIADAFISFSTLDDLLGEKRLSHWGQFDHYTYVLLAPNATPQQAEAKFPDLLKKHAPEWVLEKEQLFLQPLTSIHLHSNLKDELTTNSDEKYSYILGTIAIFILLMASANFINLSTATQVTRFREIAIRKVLGAGAKEFSVYFWVEAFVVSVAALLAGFILAYVILPEFNFIIGRQLSFSNNYWLIPLALGAMMLIAFLSGFFTVFQSGRLKPVHVGRMQTPVAGKSRIRKMLVTFQFFISIFLIMATWVVTRQLHLLESSRFGFNSDHVLIIPIKDRSGNDKYNTVVNEIGKIAGVENASFSSSTPATNTAFTYTYTLVGNEAGEQPIATFMVDEHFFDLYNIRLKEGRMHNPLVPDTLTEVLLNEAAIKHFGLADAIGHQVKGRAKGHVVGVVENFNHTSLRDPFTPVIFYAFTPSFRFISVKLKGGEEKTALAGLEKKWMEFYPGFPLEYAFLNDQIEQLYGAEQLLGKAYKTFAIIALLIAGIGLAGLTGYQVERSRKEISIRKVFGGTTAQIMQWIYSGYYPVVTIATLAAWVAGYVWMERWLQGFVHKITVGPMYFVLPVSVVIAMLLLATGVQIFVASRTNPVENLREE